MTRTNQSLFHRMASVFCVILMITLSLGGLTTPANAAPVAATAQSMSVSRSSIYFGSGASSATVTVNNVSSYSVSTDYGSWIYWSKNGNKVMIKGKANTSTSNRYGNVKIKSGSQTITISITQYCPIVVMSGSNYGTKVNSVTLQGVANKIYSPSITVKVNAAGTIRATSGSSWISTSVNGKYVTITAKPNTGYDMRRGAITISNEYDSFTLSVIQQRIVVTDICSYPYMDATTINPSGQIVTAYRPLANVNTWKSYSKATQAAYLESFAAAVKAWFGVSYSIPVYYMTPEEAKAAYDGAEVLEADDGSWSRYSAVCYNTNTHIAEFIILNYNELWNDPATAAQAVIHEYRHVYQLQRGCYGASMIQFLFKYNLDHYIGEYPDFSRYESQFIEMDARTYAKYLQQGLQRAVK